MEKDLIKNARDSIFIGAIVAFLVLASGFGMMFLLWNTIEYPKHLLGLFDYKAATIGDGICLPLLIGSIVALRKYNHTVDCNKKCIYFGGIALLIGAGIQMSWLISSETALNWSIPIQYHFNAAGWYHSLFFMGFMGVLVYELCNLWFVIRNKQEACTAFEKVLFILFVAMGSLFVLMFAADDYAEVLDIPFLFSFVVIGMLIFLLVYVKSAMQLRCHEIVIPILIGVIYAYGCGLEICICNKGDIVVALVAAISVCFIWRIEKSSLLGIIGKDLIIAPAVFLVIHSATKLMDMRKLACVLLTFLALIICIEKIHIGEIRFHFISIMIISFYIVIKALPLDIYTKVIALGESYRNLTQFAFSIIIGCLYGKEIVAYFDLVKEAEKDVNNQKINHVIYKKVKMAAYFQIVLGFFAILLLVCFWLKNIAISNGNIVQNGTIEINITLIAGISISLSSLLILGNRKLRQNRYSKILALALVVLTLSLLIIDIAFNMDNYDFFIDWNIVNIGLIACSICSCIGAPILLAHGYYMNLVSLRGLSRKKIVMCISGILFLECMILVCSMAALILMNSSWANLILNIITTVIAFIIVPALSARVIQYNYEESHVVLNKPLSGILQDGFMIFLIVVFDVCAPCIYINAMGEINVKTLVKAVGIVSCAILPVLYCLKNNISHVKEQRLVLEKYPEETDRWMQLHDCLRRQSIQTIVALLPYILIFLTGFCVGMVFTSKTFSEIKTEFIQTFIDGQYGENQDEEN